MRGKSAPADVRIRGVASSISGFNMRAPCALRTTKHHIEYIVLVLLCVCNIWRVCAWVYIYICASNRSTKNATIWTLETLRVCVTACFFVLVLFVCTLCGTLQIMGRPEKTAITGLCRGQTVSSSSPPESFLPKTFQAFPAINCLRPRFKAPAIIAPRLIQCSS